MHVTLGGRHKSKETRKNQSNQNKSIKNYKYKTNLKKNPWKSMFRILLYNHFEGFLFPWDRTKLKGFLAGSGSVSNMVA